MKRIDAAARPLEVTVEATPGTRSVGVAWSPEVDRTRVEYARLFLVPLTMVAVCSGRSGVMNCDVAAMAIAQALAVRLSVERNSNPPGFTMFPQDRRKRSTSETCSTISSAITMSNFAPLSARASAVPWR